MQRPTFECEACGKRYPWHAEMAGKKVRCRCGEAMVYPDGPSDEVYGLTREEAGEPSVARRAEPSTQPSPGAPRDGAGGSRPCGTAVLGYRSKGVASENELFPDKHIDLYLPLALLAGSAVVHVGAGIVRAMGCCGAWHVFLATMRDVGLGLIVGPAVMLVGLLIAARFRGVHFGNIYVAAMKLAAIAIAPGAVAILLSPLTAIPLLGIVAVLVIEFALYFGLIGAMFKLDESDTWYCVCVFFVLNLGVYFGLSAIGWA